MEREQKEHHALRGLYMVLFWIFLRISLLVTGVIALLQWILLWFQDEPQPAMAGFSKSLTKYQQAILSYLTFETEEKVFPFTDWPEQEG